MRTNPIRPQDQRSEPNHPSPISEPIFLNLSSPNVIMPSVSTGDDTENATSVEGQAFASMGGGASGARSAMRTRIVVVLCLENMIHLTVLVLDLRVLATPLVHLAYVLLLEPPRAQNEKRFEVERTSLLTNCGRSVSVFDAMQKKKTSTSRTSLTRFGVFCIIIRMIFLGSSHIK